VCIAGFTLDAGLLARSRYSEGPATGHLDTGFSWFPCVYKQMLLKLRYGTIPVKRASEIIYFYTMNSEMPNFEL